ncbi:MAG TPA: fused MFS/spermidine synthase [Usitatibacter sp.]|nr:fused MFS/spermidine synthase [Usitatibacter sp.]
MASIEVSEAKGVRYLHFGSPWVQGAMRIARPSALELEYTRQLMMPLLLHDARWPSSVLQVGLGAGSITRFLHRHRPSARLTVVEISPEVVAIARRHFRLPEESERLHIVVAEGHEHLAGLARRFDFIVVDAFDSRGRSGMLDSVPFYLNCRARLRPGGIVAFNLLTRSRGAAPALSRIREAFGERVMPLPITEAGNLVVLAGADLPVAESRDELAAAAARLKSDTGLDLLPTVARL